jgi:GMP synthase-like glutamine amidotransferase
MLLGILECDHVAERFQPIAVGYREMFTSWIGRSLPGIELQFFNIRNGQYPQSIDDCDVWMTTGSRASAYEEQPWIEWLKTFVRRLRKAEKPFIGICFGHQIMAEALGGNVAKAETGWGVGVHEMKIVQTESWMTPPRAQVAMQYMHQDQVVELPQGAVVLGAAAHCPVAAFRIGSHMLGIQAHPEFVRAYCEALIRDRVERIGAEKAEAALSRIASPTDEDIIAAWIGNFIQYAR